MCAVLVDVCTDGVHDAFCVNLVSQYVFIYV